MKDKKTDRRVKYTIMMLKDALVELMQGEHISKISIKSLCEAADINRSTFYTHFKDQYDLLRYIEQEALDNIKRYLAKQDFSEKLPVSLQALNRILEYVKEDAALFLALLGGNAGADIQREILKVADIITFQIYKGVEERTKDYLTAFGISGCVSVLKKWLEDGTPETTAEISELILQMLYQGITSFQ